MMYADYFFVGAYVLMIVIMVWIIIAENLVQAGKTEVARRIQTRFTLTLASLAIVFYGGMLFYGFYALGQ
jgi:hypothetical protein